MKKIIVSFFFLLTMFSSTYSQDYNTGIGIRAGFYSGITIKHFISTNTVLEGIVDTRWRGFQFTGLYEINHQAFDTERWNWYYGIGGHVGFWDGNNTNWGNSGTNYTVAGIDGILGLEYNIEEIPINIGIDWKPAFNIIGYTGFWGDGGALSVRYIF